MTIFNGNPNRVSLLLLALVACLPVMGCQGEEQGLAMQPLEDGGAYVCRVIPRASLGPLLASADQLVDVDENSSLLGKSGDCYITAKDPEKADDKYSDLVINLHSGSGRQAHIRIQDRVEGVEREGRNDRRFKWLPDDMGYGVVEREGLPTSAVVWSLFRCGGLDRMLWMEVVGASPEREDPVADAITLMRFAQNRYEELLDCTVGPPSSTSPPESETTTD